MTNPNGRKVLPGQVLPSVKHELFVQEYVRDFNATRAYMAVYGKEGDITNKTARANGHKLLTRADVTQRIYSIMTKRMKRTAVSQDKVVTELARIAFSDVGELVEWGQGGIRLFESDLLGPDQRRTVAEISETRHYMKDGEKVQTRLKTHDKVKALELLGKHLGMFTERLNINGQLEFEIALPKDLQAKVLDMTPGRDAPPLMAELTPDGLLPLNPGEESSGPGEGEPPPGENEESGPGSGGENEADEE